MWSTTGNCLAGSAHLPSLLQPPFVHRLSLSAANLVTVTLNLTQVDSTTHCQGNLRAPAVTKVDWRRSSLVCYARTLFVFLTHRNRLHIASCNFSFSKLNFSSTSL